MAKLTKEQVVLDFKLNFMPHLEGESASFVKELWDENLKLLVRTNKVSSKQADIWLFPKERLGL